MSARVRNIDELKPPHDIDAELGALGAVVLNPDALDDIVAVIGADDFYLDQNRRLFKHMLGMHEAGRKFDTTLFMDRLKAAGDFDLCGGSAYLSKVINAVPNAAHAIHYAEIVRDHATRRQMIAAATDILNDGYDARDPVPEYISRSESTVFEVGNRCVAVGGSMDLKEALFKALDGIDARASGKMLRGVSSGFHGLDNLTGGFQPGEVTIIAGRTSMGKTALALGIMRKVAVESPVMFFSLEMDCLSIADRMLSMESKQSLYQMRAGTIARDAREAITESAATLGVLKMSMDDSGGRTVSQVAAICRRKSRRDGLGLVVIDYLQMLQPDNGRDPRHEQVSKISRSIKILARELKVPIVCLAQLNRQTTVSKDQRPMLSHLRESGAIEQDADVVVFAHRPWYYTGKAGEGQSLCEPAELIVAKNRQGPTGKVDVQWFGKWMSFANKAEERFAEENKAKRFSAIDEFNTLPPSDRSEF